MDFSARTPVADHNISSYKSPCDIHLKHVFLTELGLWRNPAPKLRHIPFRFFGYHKLARTVVILNLSKILRKTDEMPYLKSLIILKNNELIVEKYINGGGPDQIHDIRSASKSILSAVLGIAIKDGYIDSIHQKIIDFFPEYITDELDPKIFDLRIRHLITMKSGFNIKETAKAYQQLYLT